MFAFKHLHSFLSSFLYSLLFSPHEARECQPAVYKQQSYFEVFGEGSQPLFDSMSHLKEVPLHG